MQAIIVTEYEREIINRLREGDSIHRRCVCMTLEMPYTKEMLQDDLEMHKECDDELEFEHHKRFIRKWQEEAMRQYKAQGNKEPPEFGTKRATALISAVDDKV